MDSQIGLKTIRQQLIQDLIISPGYKRVENPSTIFMAGAPGVGKTETAKGFINQDNSFVRIDADEIRIRLPGYIGSNSSDFQSVCNKLVEKMYDFCLPKNLNILMDSTLSSYSVAEKNINRALRRKRLIVIFYIYRPPWETWQLVKAREATDGRTVPLGVFKNAYLNSINTVNKLKATYKDDILLWCFEKHGGILPGKDSVIKTHQNVGSIDECLEVDYDVSSIG